MNKFLSNILWIVIICAIGLFAINQWLEYRYKSVFLQSPCYLCAELNKNQSMCVKDCFSTHIRVYPSGIGEWCGADGYKYDSFGNKENEKCEVSKIEDVNYSLLFSQNISP
jgi:hypothetical protein